MANTLIGNMIKRLDNANNDYDYSQSGVDMIEALKRIQKIAAEIREAAETVEKGTK